MRIFLFLSLAVSTAMLGQSDHPKTYFEEKSRWSKTHPLPPPGSAPEQRRLFDEQVAAMSAEWVRKWPNEPEAWMQRFKSLARLKATPDRDLEELGETTLKIASEHPSAAVRLLPLQTEIAEVWTERRLRPEECLQLTKDAVRAIERTEVENPSLARQFMVMMNQGLFQTLTLQMSLAIELKNFEMAESAVEQMRRYLDTHRDHPEDRPRVEHWYLTNAAILANSEGRKPDALLYYSQAFQQYPADASTETHARQLWTELGGSQDGFNAWKSAMAKTNRTLTASTSASSPWVAMNTPLTAFHATDINGRTWTQEDLKGRTTLVNVWATWCRPCQEELPEVQTIFDQWKDRKELQLLTVSVDNDLSLARRFAERQHYTFPILGMTTASVDKLMGVAGVPRTWIVDPTGAVRFELIGFDRALWPKQIIEQLEALK